MGYIFLIIALLLNATANILMKLGAGRLPLGQGFSVQKIFMSAINNFYLIGGILLFALNVIFYALSLSRINLSLAYPLMTTGGFIIITLFAFYYLKEPISALQISGLALIVMGIALVSMNLK